MIVIGEKINGSIPSVGKAIAGHDEEFIKSSRSFSQTAEPTILTAARPFRKR